MSRTKEFSSDTIIVGNCVEVLGGLPKESIDLIFADPPYNLQLSGELLRPNNSRVMGVNDDWDRFANFEEYDAFTKDWLGACRRVLKPTGSLWVIGSYHNIFRVGTILQNLGFWILNDVIWRKTNPMPNFRGRRFTNAHETLIWCVKEPAARNYTFNYDAMKSLNEGLQMRSDWLLPLCTGNERLKKNGQKAHPTQKPESLLSRVVLACSKPGDLVLDPFSGSGTTAAVAKRFARRYIGIEQDIEYARLSKKRIDTVQELRDPEILRIETKRAAPRVPFGSLLDRGLVAPGEVMFDVRRRWHARIRADGMLISDTAKGSIHSVGAAVQGAQACNGWTFWHVDRKGNPVSIDIFRQMVREELAS
ncbi:MAG: modification methylase [Rhodospirillaceae bacterium]|nr:modification methylase [Rhodospirillaceae bacterium]|tara:strand:- start:2281 stop:3369 length:1089 start_codon:yes stop_codon:yes gene_type:complete